MFKLTLLHGKRPSSCISGQQKKKHGKRQTNSLPKFSEKNNLKICCPFGQCRLNAWARWVVAREPQDHRGHVYLCLLYTTCF